jgi:hypothetical protein
MCQAGSTSPFIGTIIAHLRKAPFLDGTLASGLQHHHLLLAAPPLPASSTTHGWKPFATTPSTPHNSATRN